MSSEIATLSTCLQLLKPQFASGRVKDMNTATKYLSKAFGYSGPENCPVEALSRPLPELYALIELNLAEKGEKTIRNVKNNLSLFQRTAQKFGIFKSNPVLEVGQARYNIKDRPRRPGYHTPEVKWWLRKEEWPVHLSTEFDAFARWATDSIVEGRPAKYKKRQTTVKNYYSLLTAFFGYFHHIKGWDTSLLNFSLLFDKDLVKEFVTWHCNQLYDSPTAFIHQFINTLLAIAKQYRPMAEFRAWLSEFYKTIPAALPVYDKNDGWLPLAQIDEIARQLWPKVLPEQVSGSRVLVAARGWSLILMLWTRRPYRQKNIRQMLQKENLYKGADGKWAIKFVAEQLKVAVRNNRPNYFDLPFPEDLVPLLEEYLRLWHPILSAKQNGKFSNYVFLNTKGKPHTSIGLKTVMRNTVYSKTGKYFHPHLIRSIFATEYIRDTSDFYGAAVLLNDTLETVIKKYAHLMEKGIAEKTDGWVRNKIGRSPREESVSSSEKEQEELSTKLIEALFKDTLGASLLRKHEKLKDELMRNAIAFFRIYALSGLPC